MVHVFGIFATICFFEFCQVLFYFCAILLCMDSLAFEVLSSNFFIEGTSSGSIFTFIHVCVIVTLFAVSFWEYLFAFFVVVLYFSFLAFADIPLLAGQANWCTLDVLSCVYIFWCLHCCAFCVNDPLFSFLVSHPLISKIVFSKIVICTLDSFLVFTLQGFPALQLLHAVFILFAGLQLCLCVLLSQVFHCMHNVSFRSFPFVRMGNGCCVLSVHFLVLLFYWFYHFKGNATYKSMSFQMQCNV